MILFPVVLFILFAVVQLGIYSHARTIALAAAEEGARAASLAQPDSGYAAADDFLAATGGYEFLSDITIDADRSATEATVTITGDAITMFYPLPVSQSASYPVERLVP